MDATDGWPFPGQLLYRMILVLTQRPLYIHAMLPCSLHGSRISLSIIGSTISITFPTINLGRRKWSPPMFRAQRKWLSPYVNK